MDGSSDSANSHNLLVYFQTQEGSRVVVWFYKLRKGATAEDYLTAIKAAVQAERL